MEHLPPPLWPETGATILPPCWINGAWHGCLPPCTELTDRHRGLISEGSKLRQLSGRASEVRCGLPVSAHLHSSRGLDGQQQQQQ